MNFLFLVLIFFSASAFSQSHMIRFDLDTSSSNVSTFDLDYKNDNDGSTTNRTSSFFINYAYTISNHVQLGFSYGNQRADNDVIDGNERTLGFDLYYNFKEDILRTDYIAFHIQSVRINDEFKTAGGTESTQATSDGDKTSRIIVEYGRRFHLLEAWGAEITFAPAISLSINKTVFDDSTKDREVNEIIWDLLKIDMLF